VGTAPRPDGAASKDNRAAGAVAWRGLRGRTGRGAAVCWWRTPRPHPAHPDRCHIEVAGAVAGYAVLAFGFSLEFHGRDAFLDELYVRESFRGSGVGTACLEWLEAVCRAEGVHALHLEVDRTNAGAKRLYHRLGYGDHDRHLLTKWLTR
jgi:ribosomal protein S18 acetylase RimI-like enzyme